MNQHADNNHELPLQADIHVIAIDGPAASGKSTVARHLAKKLGFIFVSSGYYYRALAWGVLQKKLDPKNEKEISSWLQTLDFKTCIINGEARPLLNRIDPEEHLFDTEVNALVSPLAASSSVRNFLLRKLRALACASPLVMEGRDIGSIVFPHTMFKFYLHASLEERIRRRGQERESDAIAERDEKDSSRALAPLMIPEGATVIDTTHLSIQGTVQQIVDSFKSSYTHHA